ncbi:MAG: O-antigen ligase family protein [Clostridia bacterium]|nr:O-antigen ligase family protein [Clostridia bacterium]
MNMILKFKRAFTKESLRDFFMGRTYPLIVALIVIVGYFTGLEFYLHLFNMAMICMALFVCDSLRPMMMPLCSFVFQISMQNSPANLDADGPSNYYFEGARLPIVVISFVCVFIALVYFFIKNRLITGRRLLSLPYLIPSALLTVAFFLGGALSGYWTTDELGFVGVQIVCWFVIFYLFILGFKNENAKELTGYFVYISSLVALILIAEVLEIYLTTENMMSLEGEFIDRHLLRYGWGVCNTGAQAVGVVVPVLFIGTIKSERPWQKIYYFTVATLALVASIMNASRTAVLTGVPIYIVCLIVYVVKSKHKLRNVVEILAVVAVMAVALIPVYDSIELLIENYTTRGINDSGRYKIWEHGMEMFFENPIFGVGTVALSKLSPYSFTYADIIPFMMHNTPIHMLAAYGAVGFIAYALYRVCTIIPFFKKPTLEKSLLGLALLSVLIGSLLENFVFYILPMFYFSTCFAVAEKHIEEQKCTVCCASAQAVVQSAESVISPECNVACESLGSNADPVENDENSETAECVSEEPECECKSGENA